MKHNEFMRGRIKQSRETRKALAELESVKALLREQQSPMKAMQLATEHRRLTRFLISQSLKERAR